MRRIVRTVPSVRRFSSEREDPFTRSYNLLKNDFNEIKTAVKTMKMPQPRKIFPSYCDVLILGGGAIGSSIAYWVKEKALEGLNVVVVEKDPSVTNPDDMLEYMKSTSALSVGGIRQQFSLQENIQLSLYSAEFLRNIKEHLTVDEPGEVPPVINFNPCGYMFLASEDSAHILEENAKLQTSLGAKVELISPENLKIRFPWMNVEGIALASHGLENEGWFDPYCLVHAFKKKAIYLGAQYLDGQVVKFGFEENSDITISGVEKYRPVRRAEIKFKDGTTKTVNFGVLVVAAGSHSGEIGAMLGLGSGDGVLSTPLTVEPRKRFVYNVHCPGGPGLSTPFLIDPTGAYVRREGFADHYLVGMSPPIGDEEPSIDNLDVDYDFFNERIWPILSHRIPSFEKLKVKSAWAGFYDFNKFDENAFIGVHPGFHNVYLATGFSGHGIQQSPAVGLAVSELLIDGFFTTIDLSRLSFDRFVNNEPLWESNIV